MTTNTTTNITFSNKQPSDRYDDGNIPDTDLPGGEGNVDPTDPASDTPHRPGREED